MRPGRGAFGAILSAGIAILCAVPAWAGDFFTLKGHGGPIKGIELTDDGAIVTASLDNAVGVWRARTPLWLDGHRAAVNTVLALPDGGLLSGSDDFDLRLWDIASGSSTPLAGHRGKVMALALSPDARTAASASWDGLVGLWDLTQPGAPPKLLSGHGSGVNDVAFSADGTRLYSGASDGTVRVWDVASGAQTRLLLQNGFGVNRIILNEAAGWLAYGAVDGVTRVVDLETGAQIADLTLERRPILAMAASPDGTRIAIGDGEGYISIIATDRWSYVADFRATLRGPVWALHFSADGANVHAGGLDTAMYSWPVDGLKDGQRMVSETPSFLVAADAVDNGERQYNRKCSICHALGPAGERRAGPTLHGIMGRHAGALAEYAYSDTLSNSDIVWTDETIDALFDIGPDDYITGSKMPQQRITDAKDRQDLIAFLKRATKKDEQ
ncbi:MAG: c-type cytochrome [Pseudomonadota bacterium]